MSEVTKSIGLKFERFAQELFPELLYPKGNDDNIPDFYHPGKSFWIEAKTGNIRWGIRVKRYQIESFLGFQDPVAYLIGLHSFDYAYERLVQKTEKGRQNFLDKNMSIKEVHIITRGVMEMLWNRENRLNKKGTIEYCMIKRATIRHLYTGRELVRNGRRHDPRSFYGFHPEKFLVIQPQNRLESISMGAILNPKTDGRIIEYLSEKEILKSTN